MRVKCESALRTHRHFVNFACAGDGEMGTLAIEDLGVCGVDVGDGGIAFPEIILAHVILRTERTHVLPKLVIFGSCARLSEEKAEDSAGQQPHKELTIHHLVYRDPGTVRQRSTD